MFHADLATVICTVRAAVCPPARRRPDGRFDGVIVHTKVELAKFLPGRSVQVAHRMDFLLCGPGHAFYVVYPHFTYSPGLGDWVHATSHDDCWRHEGVRVPLSARYFLAAAEVNRRSGCDDAPAALDDFSELGWGGSPPWRRVTVAVDLDPADDARYRRVVTAVDPA